MSDKINSVNEILDFAIAREIEANKLYTDLAARVDNPAMCKVLKDFAEEELEHKKKLQDVKAGKVLLNSEEVGCLGIADYVVGGEARPDMSYTDFLIFAMKKEKLSYKLYLDLAQKTKNKKLKNMFMLLSKEEAQHKLRFELEYDLTTF